MAFVPTPSAETGWACEVRYVTLGYNTVNKEHPAHALLFGDTMNCSLFSEEPGSHGYQPLYTKGRLGVDPTTGYSGGAASQATGRATRAGRASRAGQASLS